MINDVDQSLRALLEERSLAGSPAAVSFAAPTGTWAADRDGQAVLDLFLYDIQEDLDGRMADWEDVRSPEGRVVGRRPPRRRYRLTYLVSAWADTPEEEHRLLASVLTGIGDEFALPRSCLRGGLVDEELVVPVHVAPPDSGSVPTFDVWSALGTSPRASIRLVVTAPVPPQEPAETETAVSRLDLTMSAERDVKPQGPTMEDFETGRDTPSPPDGEEQAPAPAPASAKGDGKGAPAPAPAEADGADDGAPTEEAQRAQFTRWRGIRITEHTPPR